jgi:hypothetical protein
MNQINGVSLYPNPATTKVNITAGDVIKAITISTIEGHQLYTKTGGDKLSEIIPITLLPAGLYQVTVITDKSTSNSLLYKTG